MISGGFSAFRGKRVLLLQGPLGPFFKRLARDLIDVGAQVTKINFNGGDALFSPTDAIAFTGTQEEWPAFFEQILEQGKIDIVLLFGDCRPMHRIAHQIAANRGVEIGVFEEGYIRPDYVTLEKFGVNAHSKIPRDAIFYRSLKKVDVPTVLSVGKAFWYAVGWAILYYCASALAYPYFRHYRHHRPLTLKEAFPWIRSAWRKYYFSYKEKDIQAKLASTLSGKFFLVALQVHNDAQIHVHSDFDSVEDFIERTITSFAQCAPEDTYLVIKHHPLDRGYHDHSALIDQLAQVYTIVGRVIYIHDQHLPTLLEHTRGVVLINSTVGLSALHHGKPLMVCGTAVYDMPGLTYQNSLDQFWQEAESFAVDSMLYENFKDYLIEHTQLNGNFYRRLSIVASHTGLVWGKTMEKPLVVENVKEEGNQAISLSS